VGRNVPNQHPKKTNLTELRNRKNFNEKTTTTGSIATLFLLLFFKEFFKEFFRGTQNPLK
jgi:hypothetical protein